MCGYPTDRGGFSFDVFGHNLLASEPLTYLLLPGDLYGGAHYLQSGSAELTPQGEIFDIENHTTFAMILSHVFFSFVVIKDELFETRPFVSEMETLFLLLHARKVTLPC